MTREALHKKLIGAIHNEDAKALRVALRGGADPNWTWDDDLAPLHVAAANLFGKGIDLLLKAGADSNVLDANRASPLHYLADLIDNDAPVRLLLEAGADPATLDTEGQTPLHRAAKEGNSNIAQALLEAGAPIDIQDKNDRTALHLAASCHQEATAITLLQHGANPHLLDRRGRTPLHGAVRGNYYKMTAALMKAGADPHARDYKGFEPMELAVGPVHGFGVRAALALLEKKTEFSPPTLAALLRNIVRRASYLEGSCELIDALLERKAPLSILTVRDFWALIRDNRRNNTRDETLGYRPQTIQMLRLLTNRGCRPPAELTAELL